MCPTGHLKYCPDHISETTGPIFMIPRPLESSRSVDVHWLGHFSEARDRVHLKFCPDCISKTTGLIFMIPRPLESSRAVNVDWLGHFSEARNRSPESGQKMPNRAPEILSGPYLRNYWADFHDFKTTGKLSGCRCAQPGT